MKYQSFSIQNQKKQKIIMEEFISEEVGRRYYLRGETILHNYNG
jgi:hypothetical protein